MRLYAKGFNAAKRTVFGLMLNDVELVSDNPLHGVITPEIMANLRKRNDKKVKQKLRELGDMGRSSQQGMFLNEKLRSKKKPLRGLINAWYYHQPTKQRNQ
jgi:hypothetical protein